MINDFFQLGIKTFNLIIGGIKKMFLMFIKKIMYYEDVFLNFSFTFKSKSINVIRFLFIKIYTYSKS